MPQVGMPLENQWWRWPGLPYRQSVECWVGPHHSAVITGIARAGLNALIELAGGKQPPGRPAGLLCDSPQVQDAVGRADAILSAGRAYRTAMITELWNTVAAGKETTLEHRARARLASSYTADSARQALDLVYHHDGSTSFKRDSRLAACWRDLHTLGQTVSLAPEWYPIGGRVYLGLDPGPPPALAADRDHGDVQRSILLSLVRTAGLEPAPGNPEQILSLLRLPFRHVRLGRPHGRNRPLICCASRNTGKAMALARSAPRRSTPSI